MRPVVVTTEFRGVFFGLVGDDADLSAPTLKLEGARNAIYWAGKRGFLGLAAHGPEDESRIGSPAPSLILHKITSVAECTKTAAKKWTD